MTDQETPMDDVPTNSTSVSEEPSDVITTVEAASTAAAASTQHPDELVAQKWHAVEQLYNVFGFSYDVAQQAVDYITETTLSTSSNNSSSNSNSNGDDPTFAAITTRTTGTTSTGTSTSTSTSIDIAACYNYILDSGLGQDCGGPVTPKEDCPHVTNHYKISIEQIPIQPSHAQCSFVSTSSRSAVETTGNNKPKGNLKSDIMYDDEGDDDHVHDESMMRNTSKICNAKENWLCLECAIIRCSRYCLGHALQHWEDTQRALPECTDGHCVAVSLSDLSVWCHICQSYLSTYTGSTGHVIQPLVSQLEYNKFHLEGDTTIIMESSPMLVQPPRTKKVKHSHDDDHDDDDDDEEMSSEPAPTDQADEENAFEEGNGKFL